MIPLIIFVYSICIQNRVLLNNISHFCSRSVEEMLYSESETTQCMTAIATTCYARIAMNYCWFYTYHLSTLSWPFATENLAEIHSCSLESCNIPTYPGHAQNYIYFCNCIVELRFSTSKCPRHVANRYIFATLMYTYQVHRYLIRSKSTLSIVPRSS